MRSNCAGVTRQNVKVPADHQRLIRPGVIRSAANDPSLPSLARAIEIACICRNSPVQLQAWVDGFDVRVHVVGKQAFATRVESTSVDYRYDHSAEGAHLRRLSCQLMWRKHAC